MNTLKNVNNYPVFLRAIEGIGLIALMIACLAISWLLRKEPLF